MTEKAVAAPRTDAGRALLNGGPPTFNELRDAILAIEAEAPAPSEPLRAALERLDAIIEHVASWPPAEDGFLDDLRLIRAALQASASEATPPRPIVPPGIDPDTGMRYSLRDDPMRSAAPPAPALDVERLVRDVSGWRTLPETDYAAKKAFEAVLLHPVLRAEYARLTAAAAEGTDAVDR